ncbi:MAG: hypothetical protein WCF18_22230, partial [Chthoniobacteraceae bacterium]
VTSALGHWTGSPAVVGFSALQTQATGVFSGTLPAAASAQSRKFHGAIFQKTQRGYGWFVGPPMPGGSGFPTGYVEFATP